MNIAPNYAGSSSALMNAAGAVAGILSPVAFGWILDRTGSWTTPFVFSVGLLLFAIIMTYWIRPDRPIEAIPRIGGGRGVDGLQSDLCKLTVSCGSVLNRGSGRLGLAKRQGMCPSSRLYSPPTLPKR